MDWKLKLMQVLECIGDMEGIWYDATWEDYGITDEEKAAIIEAYIEYARSKA